MTRDKRGRYEEIDKYIYREKVRKKKRERKRKERGGERSIA